MTRTRRPPRRRPAAAGGLTAGLALVMALFAPGCRADGPKAGAADPCRVFLCDHDGIVRADTSLPRMALIFTGGSFGDGGDHIRRVLREEGVKAGFFFTGDFYRTPEFEPVIRGLVADGHYLGPHSDRHLLYCPWDDREKTLVSRESFRADIEANFREMERFGIARERRHLFIPPYEWYNRDIAAWSREIGLVLFNFTPGTSSNADYTTPSMPEYLPSQTIYDRILAYEQIGPPRPQRLHPSHPHRDGPGENGQVLPSPRRPDQGAQGQGLRPGQDRSTAAGGLICGLLVHARSGAFSRGGDGCCLEDPRGGGGTREAGGTARTGSRGRGARGNTLSQAGERAAPEKAHRLSDEIEKSLEGADPPGSGDRSVGRIRKST